ncbi:MAG: TIGR00725 family protein [Candidatus Omnitrophota bacterium]
MNIAVIGGSKVSRKNYQIAYELGKCIAQEGWVLLSGGRTGVMEASCKGARENGGVTIGILPSYDGKDANTYVGVKIPTGIGYARNVLVVRAADIVVAISGKYGTLSEIAFAFNEGKTVLGINTWNIKGVRKVKNVKTAVQYIKRTFCKTNTVR